MANINNTEKNPITNTFWVNPPVSESQYEIPGMPGVTGVSFPEPSYTDGIAIPDKLVTINGATNYHLLDAINIDWNNAAIPWATKITKWGGSSALSDDAYEPNYEYNPPAQGGWTDGTIKETEDIVDILNYLLYRVISFDFFMDHWNEDQLQPAALRLVNYRTDWYEDVNPDVVDRDRGINNVVDRSIDNRFTVKSYGLIVNLYPYLVSKYWESDDVASSYKTKLYDSRKVHIPGVVMCDTGRDEQRAKIYCGDKYRKIVKGSENFDMFEVETISNSNKIKFISRNKHVLDGYVQSSIEVINNDDGSTEGGVDTINTIVSETLGSNVYQTNYLYKLPIVAYKCMDCERYPYTTLDVIKTLLKYNYPGIQNGGYREIRSTRITPQFDPASINTTFGITIAKSQNTVDGYASDTCLYNVTVYKGDNVLKEFKLSKSEETGISRTFKDSYNDDVVVKLWTTTLYAPTQQQYDNITTRNEFKSQIFFDSEFGPSYDASHNESDEERLKKSFVHPYFVVRESGNNSDYNEVSESINVDAYKHIYSDSFNSESDGTFILFDNETYGKITYEKSEGTNGWAYFYYPPIKENITSKFDEHGQYNLILYGLMYYPIDDVTTNRLLNPLWAELNITISNDN